MPSIAPFPPGTYRRTRKERRLRRHQQAWLRKQGGPRALP